MDRELCLYDRKMFYLFRETDEKKCGGTEANRVEQGYGLSIYRLLLMSLYV